MKIPQRVLYVSPQRNRTRLHLTRQNKIKTSICRSITEGVVCRYANSCVFAHSVSELRLRKVNPRFKSQPCREYNGLDGSNFVCYHGAVCSFDHNDEDTDKLQPLIMNNYRIYKQISKTRRLHQVPEQHHHCTEIAGKEKQLNESEECMDDTAYHSCSHCSSPGGRSKF